jgi:DNA topoisomerase-1
MKKQRFNFLFSEGPIFPPPYRYKGATLNSIKLSPIAEERLWKYARYLTTDYWNDPIFQKNMKIEIKAVLPKELHGYDYLPLMTKMNELQVSQKAAKAARSKEEKTAEKEAKDKLKEKYGFALVDGEKVPIGAFLIEESGPIITRGKDPRKGAWKHEVLPEDVTLNIVGCTPPAGWKGKVESNPKAVYVFKYSQLCGRGDIAMLLNKVTAISKATDLGKKMTAEKYDKATNILTSWNKIEQFIDSALKVDDPEIQESAVISYLMALTGIRVGGEKDLGKFADTVGMSTLKVKNIRL